MAKLFSIVSKVDEKTNEEVIVRYSSYEEDEKRRERLLKKAKNLSAKDGLSCKFVFKKNMPMHIINGISKETAAELSKHIYSNAFVVYQKDGNKEIPLYLSIFKDTAIRFKNSLPKAFVKKEGKEIPNPRYGVKEIRLLV